MLRRYTILRGAGDRMAERVMKAGVISRLIIKKQGGRIAERVMKAGLKYKPAYYKKARRKNRGGIVV